MNNKNFFYGNCCKGEPCNINQERIIRGSLCTKWLNAEWLNKHNKCTNLECNYIHPMCTNPKCEKVGCYYFHKDKNCTRVKQEDWKYYDYNYLLNKEVENYLNTVTIDIIILYYICKNNYDNLLEKIKLTDNIKDYIVKFKELFDYDPKEKINGPEEIILKIKQNYVIHNYFNNPDLYNKINIQYKNYFISRRKEENKNKIGFLYYKIKNNNYTPEFDYYMSFLKNRNPKTINIVEKINRVINIGEIKRLIPDIIGSMYNKGIPDLKVKPHKKEIERREYIKPEYVKRQDLLEIESYEDMQNEERLVDNIFLEYNVEKLVLEENSIIIELKDWSFPEWLDQWLKSKRPANINNIYYVKVVKDYKVIYDEIEIGKNLLNILKERADKLYNRIRNLGLIDNKVLTKKYKLINRLKELDMLFKENKKHILEGVKDIKNEFERNLYHICTYNNDMIFKYDNYINKIRGYISNNKMNKVMDVCKEYSKVLNDYKYADNLIIIDKIEYVRSNVGYLVIKINNLYEKELEESGLKDKYKRIIDIPNEFNNKLKELYNSFSNSLEINTRFNKKVDSLIIHSVSDNISGNIVDGLYTKEDYESDYRKVNRYYRCNFCSANIFMSNIVCNQCKINTPFKKYFMIIRIIKVLDKYYPTNNEYGDYYIINECIDKPEKRILNINNLERSNRLLIQKMHYRLYKNPNKEKGVIINGLSSFMSYGHLIPKTVIESNTTCDCLKKSLNGYLNYINESNKDRFDGEYRGNITAVKSRYIIETINNMNNQESIYNNSIYNYDREIDNEKRKEIIENIEDDKNKMDKNYQINLNKINSLKLSLDKSKEYNLLTKEEVYDSDIKMLKDNINMIKENIEKNIEEIDHPELIKLLKKKYQDYIEEIEDYIYELEYKKNQRNIYCEKYKNTLKLLLSNNILTIEEFRWDYEDNLIGLDNDIRLYINERLMEVEPKIKSKYDPIVYLRNLIIDTNIKLKINLEISNLECQSDVNIISPT